MSFHANSQEELKGVERDDEWQSCYMILPSRNKDASVVSNFLAAVYFSESQGLIIIKRKILKYEPKEGR